MGPTDEERAIAAGRAWADEERAVAESIGDERALRSPGERRFGFDQARRRTEALGIPPQLWPRLQRAAIERWDEVSAQSQEGA